MKPAPARPPVWWENPWRLPRCARCGVYLNVQVTRLGPTPDCSRRFDVTCHGESASVVLTADEVNGMRGYGEVFR